MVFSSGICNKTGIMFGIDSSVKNKPLDCKDSSKNGPSCVLTLLLPVFVFKSSFFVETSCFPLGYQGVVRVGKGYSSFLTGKDNDALYPSTYLSYMCG